MNRQSLKTRLIVSLALSLGGALLGLILTVFTTCFPIDTAFAEDSLIRLHVLPNSNLPKDQDLKLLVRDAVLMETGTILGRTKDKAAAQVLLNENQGRIQQTAQSVVLAQGFNYPVTVSIGNFVFPERAYGRLVLPEGCYDAIRVEIGRGVGENWWCVLFPPLCLAELESDSQLSLVKKNEAAGVKGVAFRSKLLEQISRTRYARAVQKWWQASLGGYPLLKN